MNIFLPHYATNYNLLPLKTEEEARKYGLSFNPHYNGGTDDYVLFWGLKGYRPNYGIKYGIVETGFFHNAAFIDTVGNYQSLSLNTKDGYNAVANFNLDGRKSAKEIIFSQPLHSQSKYNPVSKTDKEWSGPVLILQNPHDRSIYNVTSKEGYYKFINDACKFYGKSLFVKFHPWTNDEVYKEIEAIIKPYGCEYGKVNISVIDNAEFCISYNSTFAIDSLLRNVPYVQYGMGTFFQAYDVLWTKEKFISSVKRKNDYSQLPNFLIHRFCFNKTMEVSKFVAMVKHYSVSKKMFPMTDEFSYANNL